jgi:hypothetical protein
VAGTRAPTTTGGGLAHLGSGRSPRCDRSSAGPHPAGLPVAPRARLRTVAPTRPPPCGALPPASRPPPGVAPCPRRRALPLTARPVPGGAPSRRAHVPGRGARGEKRAQRQRPPRLRGVRAFAPRSRLRGRPDGRTRLGAARTRGARAGRAATPVSVFFCCSGAVPRRFAPCPRLRGPTAAPHWSRRTHTPRHGANPRGPRRASAPPLASHVPRGITRSARHRAWRAGPRPARGLAPGRTGARPGMQREPEEPAQSLRPPGSAPCGWLGTLPRHRAVRGTSRPVLGSAPWPRLRARRDTRTCLCAVRT